ncbi:MAG: helix-turn-helix domain-containing protein [Acidobacteriota bacterium]|nr:helix-turn-helix domain-containing protein [Blastocatellia bacterium]MDW8239619.1 helix-turn-helix domain-containing protein [Acidobacteriota bacterium]
METQVESVVVEAQAATLGEELRRRRERLGISLNDIAQSTCISVRFLRAIEENDFSALPGGLFTRSFIRSFARAVGMDETHALKLYYQQSGEPEPTPPHLAPSALASKSGSPRWANVVITCAILVVLALGGLAGWHYWKRTYATTPVSTDVPTLAMPTPTPPAPSLPTPPAEQLQEPPAVVTAPATEQPPAQQPRAAAETEPLDTSAETQPEPEPSTSPPPLADIPIPTRLDLSIRAVGSSYVVVQADTDMARGETLQAGDRRVFQATNRIVIYNGDASQLLVTINGREIQLPPTITPDQPVIITRQTFPKFVKRP